MSLRLRNRPSPFPPARLLAYGALAAGLLLAAPSSVVAAPYSLRAAHSAKCLDVTGGPAAIANGVALQQHQCLGAGQSNQQWSFSPTGDGRTFYVKALHSGRCLDVTGGTRATENGARLQQHDCLGYAQANQRWELVGTGDERTYYVKAAHSGKCLDVAGGTGATGDGVPLQQYQCLGYAQANQRWYFTKGDAVPVVPDLDGDGHDAGRDCNDAAEAVHPGAPETASDGIDQDCDGSDAVPQGGSAPGGSAPSGSPRRGPAAGRVRVLFVRVVNLWLLDGRVTRVRRLGLRRAPRATTVTVGCRGRGCPFARRAHRAPNGSVNLRRPFRRRRLRAGTIVRLKLDMPGAGRYEVRFRMRAGQLPRRTDYCPSRRSRTLRRCR